MTRALSIPLLAAALALAACGGPELSGPPTIRLGRDECAGCGMLVNEDRCSAALLLQRARFREHAVFDDLGCMLDHADKHPDLAVLEAFVRDYPTGRWLPAASATYLLANPDQLATPMGTGMVALDTAGAAQRLQTESGGEILDYDGLHAARRRWHEARQQARDGS